MKKLLTLSFLATKLLALYCFGSMSLSSWNIVEAKTPCHGTEIEQTAQTPQDCDACIIAAETLDQELVSTADIIFGEVVTMPSLAFEDVTFQISTTLQNYQSYYPPPQVLYKTAFHRPQSVTVILA